jgi:hemoglobin/transferrin/lactoferrin receptor protein
MAAPLSAAQGPASTQDTIKYELDPITVTATRSPRPVSLTPMPVSVILPSMIRRTAPNTVTDLFRNLPGLDVAGTGANQARPVIRGQRGQRILLLENGIRLNNSRRQQDFGELPAIVDVSGVKRVEVVRGPGSVLYGTDAIGGVINIITDGPRAQGVHGRLNYRYGDAQGQHKGTLNVSGAQGGFEFDLLAAKRDAGSYSAPAGSFGDLTLERSALVDLTGVKDENLNARLAYRFDGNNRISASFERYNADESGFGFVDPAAYDPGSPTIRILYPFQDLQRFTLNFQTEELNTALADRIDFTAYRSSTQRRLDFDLFAGFGPQFAPDAGARIETEGFSDLSTVGFRAEVKKLAYESLLVTYGVDYFRDDSKNTDFRRTTITGFGPPIVKESNAPNVPNAIYSSIGAFIQGEMEAGERTRFVLGGRVQRVRGESRATEGFTEQLADLNTSTAVGSLNILHDLGEGFTAIGTLGRAFRAPNLVEMFFEGPTPEGSGFQARNDDLRPETSLNFDLGMRFANSSVSAEAFYFRNKINDGIRITPRGDSIDGAPVSINVNVDELVFQGVELSLGAKLPENFALGGSFTYVDTKDVLNPDNPVGESYSNKTTGWLRYEHPKDYFWLQFEGRRNGEQKEVLLGRSPIGDVLPAFTVLNARLGVQIPHTGTQLRYRVSVSVENLTDQLYAEFSNASFFRPEPGRNLTLSIETIF